jgi:hypothetical protein
MSPFYAAFPAVEGRLSGYSSSILKDMLFIAWFVPTSEAILVVVVFIQTDRGQNVALFVVLGVRCLLGGGWAWEVR